MVRTRRVLVTHITAGTCSTCTVDAQIRMPQHSVATSFDTPYNSAHASQRSVNPPCNTTPRRCRKRSTARPPNTPAVAGKRRTFLAFDQALVFARASGIKSYKDWAEWSKSGHRPPNNISAVPSKTYKVLAARGSGTGWARGQCLASTRHSKHATTHVIGPQAGLRASRKFARVLTGHQTYPRVLASTTGPPDGVVYQWTWPFSQHGKPVPPSHQDRYYL